MCSLPPDLPFSLTCSECDAGMGIASYGDGGTLRQWLKKFPAAGSGSPVASEGFHRAEVRRLREENKRLLLERVILTEATAFFAKQQP